MLISGLWNAGVARRRGRGGNTAVGVQEKGGRRWREVCVFPGTRASKPAWPVANRWQARSPVGHKQLGDALFPPRAKFRESHSGLGDPASLWPPGPPSERGGVPLQDARCDAGLRMDLPLASSKAGGLGSPRSRNLPVDNHSSPRRRGAATGRPTGDRGQETGDRRQETGDRGQGTGDRGQGTGDRRHAVARASLCSEFRLQAAGGERGSPTHARCSSDTGGTSRCIRLFCSGAASRADGSAARSSPAPLGTQRRSATKCGGDAFGDSACARRCVCVL